METRQMLKSVSIVELDKYLVGYGMAYNPPSPKIHIKPIFCFFGRSRLFNIGIGNATKTISVKMLKAALKNHRTFLLMQWPPAKLKFQKYWIGTQLKIALKTDQKPKVTMNPIATQHAIRRRLPTKTRIYWRTTAILERVNERLYNGKEPQRNLVKDISIQRIKD